MTLLFSAFLGFISLGLWSMDVEDLYGNKQEIFWQGSSGDTVKLIDRNTQVLLATGILKKTWHRINIESNGGEKDIVDWLEKESGLSYVETEQKFKAGVVTITVDAPNEKAHFIGAYPDEVTLAMNLIGDNVVQYDLKAICEHQIPQLEKGLAKYQFTKKDTLIFKNDVDGNHLIISVWGEKGNRNARIFRKGEGKFEALSYDKFRER